MVSENKSNNSKMLFLALGDLKKQNIAPSRRMSSFKAAFSELLGDDLKCISGTRTERKAQIKKFISSGAWKNYAGMYIESSNRGLTLCEARLIFLFKHAKKPVSIFIRDVYPFFRAGWKDTNIKGKMANILWLLSILYYKMTLTKMYFPAESMIKYIKFKNSGLLPPAIFNDIPDMKMKKNSLFYAGGLGGPYNLTPILQAVKRLSEEMEISFTIFCREKEVYHIESWRKYPWLHIEHKNLQELDFTPQIGVNSSFSSYQSITRIVKVMDYVRLGIPAVISDSYENSRFIKEHNIGLIAKQGDAGSFYDLIKLLLTDKEQYNKLRSNVLKLRKAKEISWEFNARKVIRDLGINIEK